MKQQGTFKTELTKTAILLIIVGICVAGFWLAFRAALRTDFPLHAVVSESMVPTLQVGDLLVVQGVVDASEIKADPETGDIIVFLKPRNPNEFIVHRAVDKTYRGGTWFFKTKGDNNPVPDAWGEVPENYVIGKVVSRIPLLGYLKIFLGTPGGIALFIILILILLFADYIPLLRKKFET